MSGRALYPVTMAPLRAAAARVRRRPARVVLGGRRRLERGRHPLVRRAAGHRVHRPAEAGRLRAHGAVAGERRARRCASAAPQTLAELSPTAWRTSARAADEARSTIRATRRPAFPHGLPKVASALGLWDCVVAPCVEACAVEQDVPEYAWLIARGEYDRALEVILARNPLPGVTGYVCTHLCQTRCTRNDYEETRGHPRAQADRRGARPRRRTRPARATGAAAPGRGAWRSSAAGRRASRPPRSSR